MKIIRPEDISKLMIKKTLDGGFVLINPSKELKSYFMIPCNTIVNAQQIHSIIYEAKPGDELRF